MTYDFSNDVVIITGGTRGIGREITKRFAQDGATVVPTYYSNDEAANEMEDILSSYPVTFDIKRFDVANYDEVKAAIDDVADKFGSLTGLINNAGMMSPDMLFRMEKEDWDRVMAVNLDGAWNCTKVATDYMRKENNASIVNITSMAGLRGYSGQTPYCASKAGLIGLTRAVAHEYARRGIRSNAVAFGTVDTDMVGADNLTKILDREKEIKKIPQRRLPSPDEVTGAVTFLASDEANYITGEVLRVDGGELS